MESDRLRASRRLLAALLAVAIAASGALAGPVSAVAASLSPKPPGVAGPTPLQPAAAPAVACTPESEPNERPGEAPTLAGDVCVTGTLPELHDQDLVLWDVTRADEFLTWTFTVTGVPTTITSIHVFSITSPPDVTPVVPGRELFRVDSDATSDTPGVKSDVFLAAGRYILGISRGKPASGAAPEGAYRVEVRGEASLPPSGDLEPNDDAATARPISLPFALSGDLEGSHDLYRWTVSEQDAAGTWEIDLRTATGMSASISLAAGNNEQLASANADPDGQAHLYDLRLAAGTYTLMVAPAAAQTSLPYVITSVPGDDPAADPEPNGSRNDAVPIVPRVPASGRLAGGNDHDGYALTVDAGLAGQQLDIALTAEGDGSHSLCVSEMAGDRSIACGSANETLRLSNLLLAAGEYFIEISGEQSLTEHYRLEVDPVGPAAPDREVEPNDQPLTASPFVPSVAMRGRSEHGDVDHFKVEITGEPQLWQLDAEGTGLMLVDWIQPDGRVLGTADISADGSKASLRDLFLIPGQHWIGVNATGGDYRLRLTPLGPPTPDSEREPNNDSVGAEPVEIGVTRTGRLPGPADIDVYRFSLQAAQHVVIHVHPPSDAAIPLKLVGADTEIARLLEPVIGEPVAYDAWLEPGDYELFLQSPDGSADSYSVLVERADPFALPEDLEPNDTRAVARPMPGSLEVHGRGWGQRAEDDDWYRLEPLPMAVDLVVHTDGSIARLALNDGTHDVHLIREDDGMTWRAEAVPAGIPLFLDVTSGGEYSFGVESEALTPQPPIADLPAELSLTVRSAEIAAYAVVGQQVEGELSIVANGPKNLDLTLEAVTSDVDWTVELGLTQVSVAAGGTVVVPVTIRTLADAWADIPVRVTVVARAGASAQRTAWVELTPRRDTDLVGPQQAWPVPEALLGGIDVGATAIGGQIVSSLQSSSEPLLHDGLALTDSGFVGSLTDGSLTLAVDLAGDAPIPVAGIILDPLAGPGSLATVPRGFELSLSDDGLAWEVVLSGEITPLRQEQAFVLEQPRPARFAQLRITSTHGERARAGWSGGRLWLGEWKVVATPGFVPSPAPFNIADPALGGHVVWVDPTERSPATVEGILTEDPTTWAPLIQPDTSARWVVGFRDDRAALITELQWVDSPGTGPATQVASVGVEVSAESALGPWQGLGTWPLDRAADGSVAPFKVPDGTWARFIRFTAPGPKETRALTMPATLRVIEHATDAAYRSIVAEWGRSNRDGIHELLVPPPPAVAAPGADSNDTPENATALPADVTVDGSAERQKDADWYVLTVPADQKTVTFDVGGSPDVGVLLTLYDAAQVLVPLELRPTTSPSLAQYRATVTPGETYHLLVEQPPLSVVFSYDSSGSMRPYLSFIAEALRAFAADVVPGQEAVQIIPFEDAPLLDHWSDQPFEIQNAVAGLARQSESSAAEASLLQALELLAGREGTKAILVVTDAETGSFEKGPKLWQGLEAGHPHVFSVHVAGAGAPAMTTHLMQDWAASWGGHYQYAASHGEIDRAFDRMATWLRRPAGYTLSFQETLAPGSIHVRPPQAGGTPAVAGDVAIEIVLDTSGSMLAKIRGKSRIDIAKSVITRLVTKTLPAGVPVALRIFKIKPNSCESEIAVPLGPLNPADMAARIRGLRVIGSINTPIGASLHQVAADLASVDGPKIVVLVTDGKETCKGDPAKEIRGLIAKGLDVQVNIVGFAIDDRKLKKDLAKWARLGHGASFDAQNEADLNAALAKALAAPFRVYDRDGVLVGSGTVGGDAVTLDAGTYRVEVLTNPIVTFDDVVVGPGEGVDLQLGAAPAP